MQRLLLAATFLVIHTANADAQVVGKRITTTAGADFSCAIKSGGAYCWGGNSVGQLGRGTTTTFEQTPTVISSLSTGVTAISAGGQTACAVKSGRVYCWGSNSSGQVGDNTTTDRHAPVLISSLGSSMTDVSVGDAHACAIGNRRGTHLAGELYCWGYNGDGEVGDNTQVDKHVPTQVFAVGDGGEWRWIMVSCGGTHTTAIYDAYESLPTTTAKPYAWGDNYLGELGTGTINSPSFNLQPNLVILPATGFTTWHATDISAIEGATCVIDSASGSRTLCVGSGSSGRVFDIGASGSSRLGNGSSAYHMCEHASGGMLCWGDDSFGQIGNNTIGSYASAYIGTTFTSDTGLGGTHTVAPASSDPVTGQSRGTGTYAWGNGANGRLGVSAPACYSNKTPPEFHFGATTCNYPAGPIVGL